VLAARNPARASQMVSNAFRREGRSPLRVLKHPPDKGAKPFSVPSLFLRDVFFSLIVV